MGVLRSPLVLVSGNVSQLPPGDFVSGDTVIATAGSGLVGGGTDVDTFRFDIGLAAAPSGLIFVGTKLALDGAAQRTAEQALSSGNLAIASGNAGIAQALAGVQQILPGSGIYLSPTGGSGVVTVHAIGGSGSGGLVTATAGSGLVGGGLGTDSFRFDVALATSPSGLIFTSNKLGLDGAAQASGNAAISVGLNALASGNLAIASGNAGIALASTALASGNAGISVGLNALASGNLAIASGNAGIALASIALASGNAGISVGLNALASGNLAIASGNAGIALAVTALASGNAGISVGLNALASGNLAIASGNAGIALASTALASGNAALSRAATALASGNAGIAVGLAGVRQIIAGSGVTLSPAGGSGVVTVHASGFSPVGSGTERVFFENQIHVSGSYTITSGCNAGSFGPITVASGVVVTVPNGSVWTIV